MKLDLWKCDRCMATVEAAPAMGQPSGWMVLVGTDPAKKEHHFCSKCRVAFFEWTRAAEPRVTDEVKQAALDHDAKSWPVRGIPEEAAKAGYAECPDCATVVQVLQNPDGTYTLRHVQHRS